MNHDDIWEVIDESPDLWKAVSAAFALIVAADNDVDEKELLRFRDWLKVRCGDPATQQVALIDFEQLCDAMLKDFDAGMAEARVRLEKVRDNPEHRDLVLAATSTAVVADLRIDEREKLVAQRLSELLGVPSDWS